MSAAAQSPDQAADLLQNISLDSQSKSQETSEPTNTLSASHLGTADLNNAAYGQIQSHERSITPTLQECMEPAAYYQHNGYPPHGYYFPSYDGSTEYDGAGFQPGAYGDNASMMYHQAYGYASYATYTPDGQLYGPQQYQYPPPYFQPSDTTSASYTSGSDVPSQVDFSNSITPEQNLLSVENANRPANNIAGGGTGNNVAATVKSSYQNSSRYSNSLGRGISPSGYKDQWYAFDASKTPTPWSDCSQYSDAQPLALTNTTAMSSNSNAKNAPSSRNQCAHPQSHFMGMYQPRAMSGMGPAQGYVNRMYPNQMYGQYGYTGRSGYGSASNGYNSRANGHGYYVDSRYKSRGRGNGSYSHGNENIDGLNELNRGPRARGSRPQKSSTPITIVAKGQSLPSYETKDEGKDKLSEVPGREQYNLIDFPVTSNETKDEGNDKLSGAPGREQYNLTDFPVEYTDAKFFIIKSYSEDDVHKSIKYNVWASTTNGNKKLDAAYQDAHGKSGGCPVFLFFSVNTSGQFVGLAEMTSPVDFDKNLEYWQQDKWNGCFSVKWHIVKDVPNSLLKHIILEENENKPVTNSRDTQEVKLEKGLQMLKVFKEHSSKTCILDDFRFYEARQKTMQEKRAKQQQFHTQAWEPSTIDKKNKVGTNQEVKSEVSADLNKESNGDIEAVEALEKKTDAKEVTIGCQILSIQ